ncbi:MAG: Cysteine desulfurase NifS, partial [Parcubacteria group bacterium GW2011_GWA1_59_11]
MPPRRIYLDHAASTPVDPAVLRAMLPFFDRNFGNPGSLHSFGQAAQAALDSAREKMAALLGADFREIIFTGSATEANNLALRGAVLGSKVKNPKVLVSAVEHESVLAAARELKNAGAEVVEIPVDREGRVDLATVRAALDRRTVLVSVMYANNELG